VESGQFCLGPLHLPEGLLGQLGIAVKRGISHARARAFLVVLRVGLRFASHRGADVRQIRIRVLGPRDESVRLFSLGHFLKREDVLLLFTDRGGQQLACLAGGIIQGIVEFALDGGRPFACAEPRIEAGIGKGNRYDGCNNVNADEQRPAASFPERRTESDEPRHQH
jgi:hypothetical protein